MYIPGLIVITLGLILLIFSFIDKDKVIIKNSNRFNIVNKQKFLNLQLYCLILISAGMIVLGIIIIIYNIPIRYILPYALVFLFIDYIIILIGRVKQYIKYK